MHFFSRYSQKYASLMQKRDLLLYEESNLMSKILCEWDLEGVREEHFDENTGEAVLYFFGGNVWRLVFDQDNLCLRGGGPRCGKSEKRADKKTVGGTERI